jgi:hypothetical protein
MIRSRFLFACLFLAVGLGLLWQFYPLSDAKNRLEELPLYGPGFVGNNVPLNDFEEKAFQGVDVIKRLYRVDNENYLVTVLDGTHNRHIVHDPYYCFTGSGWEIQSKKKFYFGNDSNNGEELVLSRGTKSRAALFWFTDGKSAFSSPMEYWGKATLRRLTFGRSGNEPVLIMIQPLDSISEVNWKEVTHILGQLVLL